MKLNAATRLIADSAIAPSDSYKQENEHDLKDAQSTRERDTDNTSSEMTTEAGAEEDEETESGSYRDVEASSTIDEGDIASSQYAIRAHVRLLADRLNTESDPLTQDMENASSTSDGIVPNTEQGFRLVGDDVDKNYMNVRGCESDVLADADPKLFGLAEQPMG
jgi:hypothetical protein